MALVTTLLYAAIALLMIDSIIEIAFLSDMVSWLHNRAGGAFWVDYDNGQFSLHGKPLHLLLNQGHTSNGAAGTAFVLIGLGGILVLWLRHRAITRTGSCRGFVSFAYNFWLVMTVLSALLTLSALVFTFVVTAQHNDQSINIGLASTLNNHPYPNYVAYPDLTWTPETWVIAVLQLPLASSSDRSDIKLHLAIMRGWRWNLIPLYIIGLAVCALAFVDRTQYSRNGSARRETGTKSGDEKLTSM